MKMKRVVAWGMMVCFLSVALAGCGSKGSGSVLDAAMEKANTAENMDMEAVMDMAMSAKALGAAGDINIQVTMNGAVFVDPIKMKMNMNMDMGVATENMEIYSVVQDGEFVQYMKSASLGGWVKQVIGKTDTEGVSEQAKQWDVNMFMNKAYDYKEQPDAKEDGKTYKVYTCKLTEDILKQLLSSVGSVSGSISGYTDEMLKEIIGSMDGLEFTVWIDEEAEELYRIKMSLTEMMKKIMEQLAQMMEKEGNESAPALQSVEVSQIDIDIKYKNYNNAADFTVPEEALNAKELPAELPAGAADGSADGV